MSATNNFFYQQICVLFIHWNETMIIKKNFPHCLYGLWNFPLLLFSIFIEIMSNLFKQFFMRCIPNSIIVLVIYFIVAHPNKQSYLLTYLLTCLYFDHSKCISPHLLLLLLLLPWHEKFDNSNCNCAVRALTQKCLRQQLYTQLSW